MLHLIIARGQYGELTYFVRAVLAVDHVCFCEGVHTCVGCLGPPSCFDDGCLFCATHIRCVVWRQNLLDVVTCTKICFSDTNTSQHYYNDTFANYFYTPFYFYYSLSVGGIF